MDSLSRSTMAEHCLLPGPSSAEARMSAQCDSVTPSKLRRAMPLMHLISGGCTVNAAGSPAGAVQCDFVGRRDVNVNELLLTVMDG